MHINGTCTLFTPDPAEYTSSLNLKIINTVLHIANAPKGSGSCLRPKTHIQHTHSQHLSTRPQIIKALTATGLGEQGYLQGSQETGSGVCLFYMVASCILDQN